MLKITYGEEEYTWDEWEEMHKNFAESLELPQDLLIDKFIADGMIMHDVGYSISISMLTEIYHIIASARFNLINAFNKLYESNVISHGNSYLAHTWMRGEYLKNSILIYNSVEDYVYQMIWFAYDLHGTRLDGHKAYQSALKKCNFGNLSNELERIKTDNSKELLSLIKKYRFNQNIKHLREKLANNLKHRGNLQFDELSRTRLFGYTQKNTKGEVTFSSDWLAPVTVNIDDTIDELSEIHRYSIEFVNDIFNYINVFESFEIVKGPTFNPLIQIKEISKKINKYYNNAK
ncbi:hypothetical protein ABES02_28060 [Neobacillus pocheonensis]|uniref:hypothetical protein n=1 Tax=Neobacillus pocheonensis TaxID=363869 RepID=UPI003D2CA9EC